MLSSYDLLKNASLSLGASTPALRRLVKSKHITRKSENPKSARPRFEYRLTPRGEDELDTGWKTIFEAKKPDGDIDSLLRVLEIAWRRKASFASIRSFLRRASDQRNLRSLETSFHAHGRTEKGAFDYPTLKLRLEAARLEAEAQVLFKLAKDSQARSLKQGRASKRANETDMLS
jgi:DNA-binding PadR family transcriptional regulator